MTLAAMLSLCRQILPSNFALHKKQWKKSIGKSVFGSTVLLIGYGRIGQKVGELLRPFDAEILVADPFISSENLSNGEELVSLNAGLEMSEIISLHASGRKTVLDEEEFKIMRNGVILLNSARAELVNENALIKSLESGKVGGTWFDVFWEEPYRGRLTDFENVLLTPHISTYTQKCRFEMEVTAVNNLLRDLEIL